MQGLVWYHKAEMCEECSHKVSCSIGTRWESGIGVFGV